MLSETKLSETKWWAVFIGVTTVDVFLLIKLLITQPSTELLVAIGIISILLVLTLRIQDLQSISGGKDGFKAELSKFATKEEVKEKVTQLGDDINDLLISTVLDVFEYITLQKVRGDREDSYEFNPKGQDLLERLKNRGLIDEKNSSSISNDRSNRNIRIKDYFSITDKGKKYLDAINNKGLGKEIENLALRMGYKGG